jgi:hypothetical protein
MVGRERRVSSPRRAAQRARPPQNVMALRFAGKYMISGGAVHTAVCGAGALVCRVGAAPV